MLVRKYCVIRIGDYVELRTTVRGIKAVKSTFTTPGDHAPYTLSQVYYEGGKVLGTWDYRTFVGLSGIPMREDTLREVTKTQAREFSKKVQSWQ